MRVRGRYEGTNLLIFVDYNVFADLLTVMCGAVGGRGNADGGEKCGEDGRDFGRVGLASS